MRSQKQNLFSLFFFTFTNKTLLRVKFKYVKNINKKIKKF